MVVWAAANVAFFAAQIYMKRVLSIFAIFLILTTSGGVSAMVRCKCCGRMYDNGSGIGAESGGDLSGESGNGTTSDSGSGNGTNMSSADSNARADEAVKKGLLYDSSHRKCARGANNILSYYLKGHGEATSGADAGGMGPVLEKKYGMKAVQDTGSYQNGDTHVIQSSKGDYGHMETYMNGTWYSDFKQKGSLKNANGMGSSTLYRVQ